MPVDYSAAPPVKRGPGRPKGPATPKPPSVDLKTLTYENTLKEIRDLMVAGLSLTGQDADAGAIQLHTGAAIPVYAELAKEIEPFGKFLETFNQAGGKYMRLVMVTAPLLMQLAANHGVIKVAPGNMFNIQPPELLRATMMAEKAQAAQAAMEQMRHAQEEAERIMAELTLPEPESVPA